jgi:oligopeptidase B
MPKPSAPVAPKQPKRIEQLGRARTDDYAWMKDDGWQKVMRDPSVLRPDIRVHLEAENAYRQAMLASTETLQAQIYEEMKGRIKEDDSSAPQPDQGFDYYVRYQVGAQHPIHARRRHGGDEEVLVDADARAHGQAYYEIGHADHSPDQALFAWAEDDQGSEYFTIRVKDLATGEDLGAPAESGHGDFAFSADSEWLFWTWKDENSRPAKVFRRPARGGEDVLVYAEPDEGFFLSVSRSASDSYIVIHAGNQETTEAWTIACAEPTATPRLMQRREVGVRYEPEHWDGRWVIRTNADGAIDFKLVTAPEADPSRTNWRTWIDHRPGTFIEETLAFEGHFVRLERVNANNRIVVTAAGSLDEHEVGFDEDAYALSLSPGYQYATATLRFIYESPTTPRQWFDYDMAARTRALVKTQEVPSGHDPARYVTHRLYAKAPDGQDVPITVLMLKDTPLDGSARLMAYGYGAYGLTVDPNFSTRKLSLVDRGWIWADCHVRGGAEKGWGWFLDGRKDRKVNSFTDFIACTEHLHATGHGAPDRTVAQGRSAGGLLMGAVANLRPDLYAGILAGVPFVDLINTMSDETLPLTPPEWPEWGDPIHDAAAYDYMMSYSPYDNVAARPYPAVLATGGLSDPRVTYWEPAKWAARLRDSTTSGRPILLKINMTAGHFSSAGRFAVLHDYAEEYAWCIWAADRGWEG